METTPSELVKDIGNLASLPDVYYHINHLVEQPNSTVDDIAKAVARDPAFTLRLLRIANSPLYGLSSHVDTPSKAVSIIGTQQIRSLALSMSVTHAFAGLPNDLVSMDNFWRHSLLCALVARFLARQMRRCDPEAMFTAGLLHDIGELVIFNRMPDKAKESLLHVLDSGDELPVNLAEQEAMGFDHAAVGGELAKAWNLPPLLQECIAFHHDIKAAKQYPREAALIHIANILAQMAEVDTLDREDVPPIDPQAWEITGLQDGLEEETVREAQASIAEVEALFVGNS